ncbi:GTP cyclohydrolase, FolE2/MptA family [Streptomyces sp. NPDC087420]|uniref:GTP cyclohydrolase, FolE2/MptA family n=1 Tax=Streptomyces sp. NPDC087420 TaxID=3365785 RepID=UPI003836ED20
MSSPFTRSTEAVPAARPVVPHGPAAARRPPGARLRHDVESLLEETGEALRDEGTPCHVLDAPGTADDPVFPWTLFRAALAASAVCALQRGESADAWARRQNRRWGAPGAVAAALAAAETDPEGVWEDLAAFPVGQVLPSGQGMGAVPHSLSGDPRTDIPAAPARSECPTWAGIGDLDLALRLAPYAGRSVGASAKIMILLPVGQRGAHMSRLQEAVISCEQETFPSVLAGARRLAVEVLRTQPATAATVVVRGRRKLPTVARHSGRPSAVLVDVESESRVTATGGDTASVSLTVGIMTACPCTLRYSRLRAEEAVGTEAADRLPPTFSHSQPGRLTVTARGPRALLPAESVLFDVCAQVAHLREAVLKRPDEHDLVERSHRRPQFTEDLCRAAAAALASRVDGDVRVRVTTRLLESIHPHSAEAEVEGPAASFWEEGGPDADR